MLLDDAKVLLSELGTTFTLRKVASGAYNTSTDSVTTTETDYTVTGALLNYSDKLFDGEIIKRGDRKAVIAGKGLTVIPETNDKIVINGDYTDAEIFSVVNVRKIQEKGVNVVYICQIRG